MNKLIITCIIVLMQLVVVAQNKIYGRIMDQENQSLPGATIFIPELNKGTVANMDGTYELLNLPSGQLKIQYNFIGYDNHIENVVFAGESINLNVSLKQIAIAKEEIVVSSGYNSTQHENAVKIDVLKLNLKEIKSTPNFTETLTKIPGVDMISKGSGVAKPVIRGLSMNDILVLNNGVRFENYQYSSHHPLGIDEFGIAGVEVIKGPASLLYGSDAIGGVLNFIKEKPAPIGTLSGDYNLQFFSNTLGMTNNFGMKGTSNKFFGGFRIGQKTNADFLQGGGDFVPNSRFNELSFKAITGFTDKIGTFKLFYDFNKQKLGLVEDEAIEAITERGRGNDIWYQNLNTHLLSSQNKLYFGQYKLDINSAFQNTELIHVGDIDVIELQMKLATLTYEAKLHLPSNKNSEYTLGFQGFNQSNTNTNDRETILLPDATTNNYSAFGLMQLSLHSKLKIQTGLRYDYKTISTLAVGLPSELISYRAPVDKDFGSFSGSIGLIYTVSEKLLFRTNYAASYRTPNLAELTSNGPHELRYEIGNNALVPENAYESDVSMHYHGDNFTFDLAAFYNRVNHYIFISPSGETTASGMPVFRYLQANSNLYGGEAVLHYHPKEVKWLHSECSFASVVGKQESGAYLPFIPAHKLRLELRAEKDKLMFLQDAFVSLTSLTAFDQNNAAPDETPTVGYSLFDINLGGNLNIGTQKIMVSIAGNNILDKKYIDHLSTLKEVNLYNPGRNIALSLKIPFSLVSQ
ncbi:MAG: TonB-dependent receptor domain-containing protein [Prolixibacteraceae bacterium]